MELADRIDEILEKLWVEVTEHKSKPDITVWKDTEEFKVLLDNGFISLKNEHLLTHKGLEEGRLCVRRHRLAERLVADVFHLKAGLIHETGCKIEHILRKGLEDNICILLGHPGHLSARQEHSSGPVLQNEKTADRQPGFTFVGTGKRAIRKNRVYPHKRYGDAD